MAISFKACDRHNRPYHIDRFRSDSGSADNFEVVLFYRNPETDTQHVVARIENRTGATIFEKNFEPDQPTVPLDYDFWQAFRQIDENWEDYADEYEQNHAP